MSQAAKPKRVPKRWYVASLIVIGAALLVIAGLGFWDYFARTQTGDPYPAPQPVTTSTDHPSEKKPVISDDYTVPANQPRLIKIPSLDITAYVQPVGIDEKNAIAAPNNIYFAGWYTGSVVPGESGVSIVDGHAGGRYEDGVFRHIATLTEGETLDIQMGDLSWRHFAVVSNDTHELADAAAALFKDYSDVTRELHLITCDGTFDDNTQTYDQRTIVVAKFVEL